MIQEQATPALISEKNKSRKKRQKKEGQSGGLGSYETLLAERRLEDEYDYKNYLRMTSANFEEVFQLIKDNITK